MNVKATTICQNCGQEFAEHKYVPDSITQYKCPHPHVECTYGFFHGGDPRRFSPDYECCTQQEIELHKQACQLWDELEDSGQTPTPENCKSGWIYDQTTGERIGHVLKSKYGIGIYSVEFDQFFDELDMDYEDDEN